MTRQINYRGAEAEVNDTSSSESWPLGTRMYTPGGRVFRRALAGADALAVGTLACRPCNEERHCDLAVSETIDIGDLEIKATAIAAIAADEYADGLVYVNDGPGQGYAYVVVGNTAASPGSAVTVSVNNGPEIALSTSSRVSLIKGKFNGVRTVELGTDEPPIGLVPVAVTAEYHFWLQTAGPAVALQEGALAENYAVGPSNKTNGAVAAALSPISASDESDSSLVQTATKALAMDVEGNTRVVEVRTAGVLAPRHIVGFCLDARVDTDYALIEMTLE